METFAEFQGKLGDYNTFLEYHLRDEEVTKLIYRVYAYAHLGSDLNLKNVDKMNQNQKVQLLLSKLSQITSYIAPEILSLGEAKVFDFINRDERLNPYKFPYEKLFRSQEHVLDDAREKILANFAATRSVPTALYQSLSVIDRQDEEIILSNGSKVLVTQASFRALLESAPTAEDRKAIFTSLYKKYVNNKSAFAATYNLVLQQLAANYKSRNYKSALEAALFGNNIPESVFLNLKDAAYENTHPLKRYIEIRKKALGMKEYFTYDRFIPLAKSDKKYPYEEAKKLFIESIQGFPEFVKNQLSAIEDGFVDAYPQDGKRTGAYSSGFYGFHPFILLNHDEL